MYEEHLVVVIWNYVWWYSHNLWTNLESDPHIWSKHLWFECMDYVGPSPLRRSYKIKGQWNLLQYNESDVCTLFKMHKLTTHTLLITYRSKALMHAPLMVSMIQKWYYALIRGISNIPGEIGGRAASDLASLMLITFRGKSLILILTLPSKLLSHNLCMFLITILIIRYIILSNLLYFIYL